MHHGVTFNFGSAKVCSPAIFKTCLVSITLTKAKLMVCSLRSPTLPLQYISPLSILVSALLMMLQRSGMICLMMYVRPLLSTHSEKAQNLSLCTSISTLIKRLVRGAYLFSPKFD